MSAVPAELDTMIEFPENDEEFVPPLAIGSTPDTPDVRETVPPRVESDRHDPEIEKHPRAKFTPPVELNVVVAGSKLTTLLIAKIEPGVVEEIPTYPFGLIVRTDCDDVASP